MHEKPTGLEVIKRLIKHGLVNERNDENDKRSKRVFLTDKGQALFFATVKQLNKVALIVLGDLTKDEKKQLYPLLKKLEYFHNPFYLSHKEISLDQLVKNTIVQVFNHCTGHHVITGLFSRFFNKLCNLFTNLFFYRFGVRCSVSIFSHAAGAFIPAFFQYAKAGNIA